MKFTVATIATLAAIASALPTEVAAPKGKPSKSYLLNLILTDLETFRRLGICHLS
jgi:hypothetical protein